jgi:uncharacterized membrane protein
MENNNENQGSTNWTPPESSTPNVGLQQPVPNSMGAFVLGIVSLVLVPICCCYGQFIALITSIIGLVLALGAIKKYNENPSLYDEKSFKRAKTGKLLSIIALVLAVLFVVLTIVLVAMGTSPDEYKDLMDKYK